jgi:type III secretory pathway lipoprotein EscJ
MQKIILLAFVFCACFAFAQKWSLKVTSHIGFRKYALDTKAVKEESVLGGAFIKLYKGSEMVDQTVSDAGGYFSIFVPANDEFILTVTLPGCIQKKIYINTTGVPEEAQKQNIKPSISIEGFILSKPLPGIDYSSLEKTLAKIVYIPKDKNFGDEEMYTKEGLATVARIEEAELALMNSFCEANKAGDEAMKKQDCVLAKKMYTNAKTLLPAEHYPIEQMAKVEDCFKVREEIAKKAEEMVAAQLLEEKYAEAIKKADEAFNTKNWTIAKESYTEALSLKSGEQYPKYKISAVDKMITEETVTKNDLAKAAELKAKYDAVVKRAEELYAKKLWTDAEDAYYEALGLMPNEKYPKQQIVTINKMVSREFSGNDKKYKDAIAKTSKLEPEYVQAIKKTYEDALTYESDASYLKKKNNEPAIPVKNSEHIKAMLAKYPQGLTEEIINGNGVVIVKRILIKDGDAWVYQKKIFNWGGITCFRDDMTITESIFENETRM